MFREYMCAARVSLWLLRSAVDVRRDSLPALCARASRHRHIRHARLDLSRVVAVVRRMSGLPVFSLPIFPRICMRQSLALYRELSGMGYAAAIHFGVRREGLEFIGHSWVSVDGRPVAEPGSLQLLSVTYSYSTSTDRFLRGSKPDGRQ